MCYRMWKCASVMVFAYHARCLEPLFFQIQVEIEV
jgi:hypothetical protein